MGGGREELSGPLHYFLEMTFNKQEERLEENKEGREKREREDKKCFDFGVPLRTCAVLSCRTRGENIRLVASVVERKSECRRALYRMWACACEID